MRLTQEQVNAYLARRNPMPGATASTGDAALATVNESDLHDQILAECRRRGWLAIHSRMDRKTTTACGTFDFIILTDIIRYGDVSQTVLLVEAKTRTGKLTVAQQALHAHARKLGHTVHVVRSFDDFLKLL